jgi:hypothetical protein
MSAVFTDEDRQAQHDAAREIGWLATFGMEIEEIGDAENGPRLSATPPKLDEITEMIAHIGCTGCWGAPTCLVHLELPPEMWEDEHRPV